MASIQDPSGPLRTKEDDLIANTILEKASDWTSPKPLLMALLQRLIQEMSLPFANQVIMAALKHDQGKETWLKGRTWWIIRIIMPFSYHNGPLSGHPKLNV